MAAQALMPQLHVAGWAGSTLVLYVWLIDACMQLVGAF